MYSPNSFLSRFPPSCPLAFIHTDIIRVVSEAGPRSPIYYLHHNRAWGHRQGWGSVVPAAIQPLSTKIVPGPKRFLSWILTGRPEGDDGFPDASDSKCKLLWVVVFRKTSSSLAGVSNKAAKLRYPEIIASWWCRAHSSQPVACNTHRTEIKWTGRFHKFIMSPA